MSSLVIVIIVYLFTYILLYHYVMKGLYDSMSVEQ